MPEQSFEADNQDHFQLAGHLLVLTIWIQNMLTDILILRKYPDVLKDFQELAPDDPNYFESFKEKRFLYDQKGLSEIINEWFDIFPASKTYEEHFSYSLSIRDLLAHGRYSLKRISVLHQPKRGRRNIDAKLRASMKQFYEPIQNIGVNGLSLKMTREDYEAIFGRLMVFDRLLFPFLADGLQINLNRLK